MCVCALLARCVQRLSVLHVLAPLSALQAILCHDGPAQYKHMQTPMSDAQLEHHVAAGTYNFFEAPSESL